MRDKLGFTKGDWKATKGHIGSNKADYVRTDSYNYDGIHIHNGEKTFGCSSPESESNAILIANSPRMVRDLIYFCKRCDEGSIRSKTTYERFRATITESLPSLTWDEIKEGVE